MLSNPECIPIVIQFRNCSPLFLSIQINPVSWPHPNWSSWVLKSISVWAFPQYSLASSMTCARLDMKEIRTKAVFILTILWPFMFIISCKRYLLNRLREVPFFLRDSRGEWDARARVKVTPREKGRETHLAFNEITHQRHTLLLLRELTQPVQVWSL